MINMLLNGFATLLLAGLGFDPSLVVQSTPTCVTSLAVSSTVTSSGAVTVTVAPTPRSIGDCTGRTCNFTARTSTPVPVSYDENNDQFEYLDAVSGPQVGEPTTSITPTTGGASVDFGVMAAYVEQGVDKLAWKPDPKITVTKGSCN